MISLQKRRADLGIFIHLDQCLEQVKDKHVIWIYGIGGFGEVRKCSNKKSGSIRAVKIIRKDTLDAKEKIRFFTEIDIMRQLDHPNIVRLYEVFQDEKRFYLVTELCTGGELFDEISKRTNFSE